MNYFEGNHQIASSLRSHTPLFEQLLGTQTVVSLERLVYPGIGRKKLHRIVGCERRQAFGPYHRTAQLRDRCVVGFQHVDHRMQGMTRVRQIIDQQHLASNFAFGRRDESRNVQMSLHCSSLCAVRARRHDGQWFVKNPAQDITWSHPPRARHRIVSNPQPD